MIDLLNKLREILRHWWSEFTLQTKLMAAATLVVSLLMSGLTFWAVNSIQQDARIHDTRFGRDLGVLLATNVTPLIGENNLAELAQFSQRFYSSTSNVRYMLFADADGEIYFGIPYSQTEVQNSLTIRRRMQLPDNFSPDLPFPLVRQHLTPDGEVTDVFVPITYNGKYMGVLAIGTNPNPTVVTSSHLTRDVTIAVFVSIWVMVILGAVFNALTITKPIKELLVGVKNIAAGNFKQRIDLPLGGELGELILSFNDMAERLETYEEQNIEELTAEKAKLETLVSTIADGAVLLDRNLHIVLVNPTARRLFGWDAGEEVLGHSVLERLPEPLRPKLSELLTELAEGKQECDISRDREPWELCVTIPGSTNRTIRIWLTTVLDQSRENLRGIAITVQDITRETELNEAKSQFISNVSHELRTPLFNIKSFIETLHEYGEDLNQSERREFLETANRETDRLTRLVNDVLDLSRLESGKRYHFDAVDLAQTIDQTLRTHQLNARDKGIELQQELAPDLPTVLGNYDLLLQVFNNLLGNALKFTRSGGCVVIRAYVLEEPWTTTPTHVRVEISDTGIGIDPEDQHAIFDRFYRVENRVHTLEGTGLGLSIVRNIIEKHQSHVHLVSEVGVGTTFWFDLPIYQAGLPMLESHTAPGATSSTQAISL
ncbi:MULTISPECIES: two-component system sensor histidine kinase NblS [unclassified Leptolyngbya]|uniref:two-component system sensor histidine kinase NblS n=1 Tax=unclassified Leptolyngbya TaxID=2650499 RepID=UPI0016899C88|nr:MULTISPECIES: ATP-binding protein [unclassified Leptolyngbya]MBD1912687.1 PAS domain-containing protein [Leptolyngbya sp. FACHB-8]MBD2154690.1 PAS domain-containing protein [Leptolyngbya sp. FACHB-16]